MQDPKPVESRDVPELTDDQKRPVEHKTNLFRSTSISNVVATDKFRISSKSTPYPVRAAQRPLDKAGLVQKATVGVYASKSVSPQVTTLKRTMSLSNFVSSTGPFIFSSFAKQGTSNISRRRMISVTHPSSSSHPLFSWKKVVLVAALFLSFSIAVGHRLLQQLQSSSSSSASSPSSVLDKPYVAPESFDSLVKSLKSKYSTQSANFWANLQSSYRHSIVKSRDPSIILIASDRNTSELATNISYDILQGVAEIQRTQAPYRSPLRTSELVVSPTDAEFARLIRAHDYDQVKLHLDTRLDAIFRSGQRIALVENIQLVPATAMIIFYTYGDVVNAKHPGVMILMGLVLDETLTSAQKSAYAESTALLNGHVEDYLSRIWSTRIGDDQLKPLFTRIANNVVLVV